MARRWLRRGFGGVVSLAFVGSSSALFARSTSWASCGASLRNGRARDSAFPGRSSPSSSELTEPEHTGTGTLGPKYDIYIRRILSCSLCNIWCPTCFEVQALRRGRAGRLFRCGTLPKLRFHSVVSLLLFPLFIMAVAVLLYDGVRLWLPEEAMPSAISMFALVSESRRSCGFADRLAYVALRAF